MKAGWLQLTPTMQNIVLQLDEQNRKEQRDIDYFNAQVLGHPPFDPSGNLLPLKKSRLVIALDASDEDVCDMAERAADECWNLAKAYQTMETLRTACDGMCQRYGIEPPAGKHMTDGGAVARMCDVAWWRRRLRVLHGRQVETNAIERGLVNKQRQIYASDDTVFRRQKQNARNAMAMENTTATNEFDQEFTLAELAAKGPANKEIRRHELMTRINGFERIATESKNGDGSIGHAAVFMTITAGSMYHAWKTVRNSKKVIKNKKHVANLTPRDAQAYIGKVWARIRSALAKAGVKLYGFRVAEPQHDGTPHWHLLTFLDKCWPGDEARAAVPRVCAIVRRYALGQGDKKVPNFTQLAYRRTPYKLQKQAMQAAKDAAPMVGHRWMVEERRRQNWSENGAKAHRCDFVTMDAARGTAAGYIAKYIAKNIDGYGLEKDLHGNDSLSTCQRVEAWASTWGIRQFQQIGGAPVGPWRELRRVKELTPGAPEHLEAAHRAVNKMQALEGKAEQSVSWKHYIKAQGGVHCGRAYRIKVTKEETPGALNKYGEQAPAKPVGVDTFKEVQFVPAWAIKADMKFTQVRTVHWFQPSKRFTWVIKARKRAHGRVFNGEVAQPSRPWTRVNNCTGEVSNGHRDTEKKGTGGQNGLPEFEPDDQTPSGAGIFATAGHHRGAGHRSWQVERGGDQWLM